MAETFMALQSGPHGFEQRVCIKIIREDCKALPKFVEAFIAGMEKSGHRYGSTIELTDAEARDIAEEGLDEMRKADQVHGRDFPLAPMNREADDG